ncbi:MAG: Calx-beta domain-containing protein [Clostridiaceae bacterium]
MKTIKKCISIILVLMIILNVSQPAMGIWTGSPADLVSLVDANGNTVTVDDSWETTFPYGTFAFNNNETSIGEGGENRITVYRLGGTKGRATAYISVSPVIAEIEKGKYSFANAAGTNDFEIQTEDTLPVAAYQPLGKAPDPLKPDPRVAVLTDEAKSTSNVIGEGGQISSYGNTCIYADTEASAYQWQMYVPGTWGSDVPGVWKAVSGATDKQLLVSNENYADYDYRCIFNTTGGGVEYCTDSARAIPYEPFTEVLPEAPEGLELNPEPSYTRLLRDDGEFDSYLFKLTFAEGEWKKDIVINAGTDELSEADELAVFTIVGCEGGSLYDTANTLAMRIEDNNKMLPSFAGFEVSEITCDKASGSAFLTVKRTGGIQYVFTADYAASDNTAAAGKDYAKTSGTLYFAGGVDTATIEIPLINDGIISEKADKWFTVSLSNPKGGGAGSAITAGEAKVNLFNSGAGKINLATMLYTPDADDLSGAITETEPIVKTAQTPAVTVVEPADEHPAAEFVPAAQAPGEFNPMSYMGFGNISFSRSKITDYNQNFWMDWAYLAKNNNWFSGWNINDVSGYLSGSSGKWSNAQRYGAYGWYHTSEGTSSGYLNIDNFGERFDCLDARMEYVCDLIGGGYLFFGEWGYSDSGITLRNKDEAIINQSWSVTQTDSSWSNPTIWYKTAENIYWNIPADSKKISMEVQHQGDNHDAHGESRLTDGALRRRIMAYYPGIIIHTADDDLIQKSEIATSIYKSIFNPEKNITLDDGGVTNNGNLYVGSALNVSAPVSASYKLAYETSNNSPLFDKAIYLADASGKVINKAAGASAAGGKLAIIDPAEGSMLNTNGQYSINVVMTREQKLTVDLSPSVPRLTEMDKNGNTVASAAIDPSKIDGAVSDFWTSITQKGGNIKVKYRSVDFAKSGNFSAVSEIAVPRISFPTKEGAKIKSIALQNVSSVNFGLPAEDIILFNGISYAGNEWIDIPASQMLNAEMTFRYYDSKYISAINIMTLNVERIEQYADANRNGKLDGALAGGIFDTTPVNVGGTDIEDVLMNTIDAKDYEITQFGPLVDKDGNLIQQFFKIYYSMTPRCLVTPEGAGENDYAQILPAFVTNITNSSVKASLTPELQGYRIITSGKDMVLNTATGDYGYTSDSKLMYTSLASRQETVDVPLGGDYNPIQMTFEYKDGENTVKTYGYDKTKGEAVNAYYESANWKPGGDPVNNHPNYRGNLLYTFKNPEPIFIDDTPIGDMAPVAEKDPAAQSGYKISDLNNYLGSYNANDTIVLCIREQTKTTGEIKSLFGLTGLRLMEDVTSGDNIIEVDSVNQTYTGTIPDSDGLKNTAGGNEPGGGMDTGGSDNPMGEFNMDMNVALPSLNFKVSDYITVILNGYEAGFSIGIPLFKAEKKTDSYTSSDQKYGGEDSMKKAKYGDWEKSGPKSENAEAMSNIKKAFANPGSLLNDSDWKDVKDAKSNAIKGDKAIKSKGMEFSIAANVTIMFKYNPLDNEYRFTSAIIFVTGSFEFKFTARLTVCPILYAYFIFGASIEASGGVKVDRVTEEDASKTINPVAGGTGAAGAWKTVADAAAYNGDLMTGSKGDSYSFNTSFTTGTGTDNFDAVNIYFKGKLAVTSPGNTGFKGGYITSDGTKPVTVKLDSVIDKSAAYNVLLDVLEAGTSIDKIVPVSKVANDTYFSGLWIKPELFIEVGVGIGVECLKAEIYFKASINCSMSFATRDDTGNYTPFTFESMSFRAGIGVRVVLLMFEFELDAIQFGIDFDKNKDTPGNTDPDEGDGFNVDGWKFAWYALNEMEEFDAGSEDGGFPGIKISVPANSYWAQQIYGPGNAAAALDELENMAYDPTDAAVPFQISGYSSSGNAFKLADGLVSGTDYQLLTAGDTNYLLYTISRNPAEISNSVDSNMLVLSKVVNTGSSAGLKNPVDENSETRYIRVDNDNTGDLDFSAWVVPTTTGSAIHVAWVSYANPSAAAPLIPAAPDAAVYPVPVTTGSGITVAMNEKNYTDIVLFPVPAAPSEKAAYDKWTEYFAALTSYNTYIQSHHKNAS